MEGSQELAKAIRDGFSDVGDRIAGGNNPENIAMSLKMVAEALDRVADALNEIASNSGN